MIQFEDEVLFDALAEDDTVAVRPDELGLLRFARSVRNVFFPEWSEFDAWRFAPEERVNWSMCCDQDTKTLFVPDLIFADRDALRAFLIVACTLARHGTHTVKTMSVALTEIRDAADQINRRHLADYMDDVIHGIRNGDVSLEHGSHMWVFTSLEWVRPAEDAPDAETYDKLFEDSLIFSELKQMLEEDAPNAETNDKLVDDSLGFNELKHMPEEDTPDAETPDTLFEDSLMFSNLKHILEEEFAAKQSSKT